VTPNRKRAIRDGLLLVGLLFNAALVFVWGIRVLWTDLDSFWRPDLSNLYGLAEQSLTVDQAFRFAPVVAWALTPLGWLSWGAFVELWVGLDLIAIVTLARRWTVVVLLAFPPVLLEILNGNIHLFLALAIWAGLRWPAAWAFVFLTKVTPGVGVIWFAARREWRHLAIAIGATAAIFAVGTLIAPGLWLEWLRSLAISASHPVATALPPLLVRYPVAIGLAWYAGRSGRAWLVPVACVVAMPTIWVESSAILLASLPLWRDRERWRRQPVMSAQERLYAGEVPA
jgi:hypothetical protein